jgi:hypothetical protein
VAVLYDCCNISTNNSDIGVLPVPPTARLPTHMIGKLKEEDFKIFLSNKILRNLMMAPYKKESGSKRYLKLFNSKAEYLVLTMALS